MRPRVDLVVDQVVQLEHVHDAHGDVVVERLAGAAVEQHRLARWSAGSPSSSSALMSSSLGAVEHRRRDVDALAQRLRDA